MCQCRHALLLAVWWICASNGDIIRNVDICGPHNGRRLYVELGEQGYLRADNVSLVKNSALQDSSRPYATNSSHNQCSLELITCPSCVINLTFKSISLLHHCDDGGMTIDSPCRCDYVWVSEPPYEDVSGTPFCGHYAPITYRSNTRTLSIALLYSQSHEHAFSVEYTAERNRLVFKGSSTTSDISKSTNNTVGGVLTSPFFPARYPRDLGMEYIVSCPPDTPTCRVRIIFSDFQLATVSIMEFYDWNGQRLDVSSGARFRPPIIVSSGPSLLIRFYANGGTGLGYKAFYSFVLGQTYDKHNHPVTDCGGYVDNLGGTITMMDMVGEGVKTYDCVWLIRPPKNFLHMKTHMYLKVITFAEMAGNTELIIKQGPTSALMPLEILRHPVSQLQPPKLLSHIAPITSGFHVSLRGSFGPNSRLAIAYATFSYMDCFTGSDFLCQNHRCISSYLNCDGFDHCGDNSDEPATCLHEWDVSMPDRKWQLNKANYYFPKIDRYPDLKTATLVFVASSLGLIILISTLLILLYRVGARARQQRELQSRLRTISELLDGARIDEVSASTDEPPVYEAPPNYDEVIKLGMDEESGGTRRKKCKLPGGSRRSRSNPSSQCSCECDTQQLTLNICEDAALSSQTSPLGNSGNLTEHVVPESPPPPYVTPPGTAPLSFDDAFVNDLPGPSGAGRTPMPSSERHESSDSGSSPTQVHVCRGDCQEARVRRRRLRNSGSLSRSLPVSRAGSSSPPLGRNGYNNYSTQSNSSEVPDNTLGAYLVGQQPHQPPTCNHQQQQQHLYHHHHHHHHLHQEQHSLPITPTAPPLPALVTVQAQVPSFCCDNNCSSRLPQPKRSSDASTCTRAGFAASCASAAVPIVPIELHRRDAADPAPVVVQPQSADGEGAGVDDAPGTPTKQSILACTCEGACGCASAPRNDKGAPVQQLHRSSTEDESPSARKRITKVLAGSRLTTVRPQLSLDSSCLSTSCSTPCGTFSEFCRGPKLGRNKPWLISDRVKLKDEFDVVSETTSILGPGTLANTPKSTPIKVPSLPIIGSFGCTRYSSTHGGDIDDLYESIKILDSFLAQRSNSYSSSDSSGCSRQESTQKLSSRSTWPMAVMLFGTPRHGVSGKGNHGTNTCDSGEGSSRVRTWKSEDSFEK
ncbi:uncharacterized protein LOC106641309 isoform X2 [Copidosoma floridanum]|uniref:uncharacterized protein LOC106641309 isoform X2 n=1 Tax=Copidosoma floridanum TaxID=29053 RepID=UPI0006C983A6|nr:uncharacterized protein LOC106641309 isoform X2 [Copidosoma floridanum]